MSYLRQMDVEESAMAVAGAGEEAGAGAGAGEEAGMPSRKIIKIFDLLVNICAKNMTDDLRTLHASVLFSGNKIISSGINNITRRDILLKNSKSEHAEVAACRNYSHYYKKPPKKSCLLWGAV